MLPLGDDVLEIETGYNRPDLTSVYGIAREVAALTGATLNPMPGTNPQLDGDEWVEIQIEDPERCPCTSAGCSTASRRRLARRG